MIRDNKFLLAITILAIVLLLFSSDTYGATPPIDSALSSQKFILQLQEQIKTLQTQVADLKAKLQAKEKELTIIKIELQFAKTLQRGASGEDVKKLQEFLKNFPDIYPTGTVSGYFGPLTEEAVKKFQEKNGLEPLGVVGPRTRAVLNEVFAPPAVTPSGTIPAEPAKPAQPFPGEGIPAIPAKPAVPAIPGKKVAPPPAPPAQCADGLDNDSDGFIDLSDPGCANSSDNDEINVVLPPPSSAFPAPHHVIAHWVEAGPPYSGNYGEAVEFRYPSTSLGNVRSFRIYHKKPGDSAFQAVATFSNLSSVSCVRYSVSGDWELSCGQDWWYAKIKTNRPASFYALGEYNFYVAVIDTSGVERVSSAVAKKFNLSPLTILSPTVSQSPVSLTPTIQWTVASGWPEGAKIPYWVSIFDSSIFNSGYSSLVYQNVPTVIEGSQTASKIYDGKTLDPAKKYILHINGFYNTVPTSQQSPDCLADCTIEYVSMDAAVASFSVASSTIVSLPPPPPATSTTTATIIDKPDFTVSDIYSDNGKLSVKISNIGPVLAPSGIGHLYIWIDDVLKWTYSLSTLANQSYLLPGGVTVVQPQVLYNDRKIKATIDPNNVILELNEANNTLEKTVAFPIQTTVSTTTSPLPSEISNSVTVISPNGGECMAAIFPITWSSPLSSEVAYWDLSYSLNNGSTYSYVQYLHNPPQRSYNWATPDNISSAQAKIKIRACGPAFPSCAFLGSDTSDDIFSISQTCSGGTAPVAPSDLTATPKTYSNGTQAITLKWADNSNNELGFAAYKRIKGSSQWSGPSYTSSSLEYQGLQLGATYEFKVRAGNQYGYSADSNTVFATVGSSTISASNPDQDALSRLALMLESLSSLLNSTAGLLGNIR